MKRMWRMHKGKIILGLLALFLGWNYANRKKAELTAKDVK